jgi:hypothetical protein
VFVFPIAISAITILQALGGLALGVLLGPMFGSVFYEIGGKSLPFIILAIAALLNGGMYIVCIDKRKTFHTQSCKRLCFGFALKSEQ